MPDCWQKGRISMREKFEDLRDFLEDQIDDFRLLKTRTKVIIVVAIFAIVITILTIGVVLTADSPVEKTTVDEVTESVDEEEPTEESEISSSELEDIEENSETEEEVKEDKDTVSTAVVSAVNIFFNGVSVKTYASKEDALNNPISISNISDSAMIPIQSIIGYGQNVKRVRVWTESDTGVNNGDEYILWKDTDWSATMDLSKYSGTIVVTISVADNSTPPHNTYEYYAMNLNN